MAAKGSIRLDGLLENVGQSVLDAQVRIDKATLELAAGAKAMQDQLAKI